MVKDLIKNEQQIIEWRRHLHTFPELSGQEVNTAKFLSETLRGLGFEVKTNVFENGILATLPGDPTKKCVALRADMDALPIVEENNCNYKSQNQGVMHACGHDAHMAMVLGVAAALKENSPLGTVKFIFQPREEKAPGGAKFMIENGVLANPTVDAILGFHVNPNFPVGTIGLKNSTIMAVADDFKLTISGKGGHGSSPHVTIDPIVVASEVVVALQTISSRLNNPMEPLVITIGTIHGGTAQNIIPDKVEMTGTLRCLNNQTRDLAVEYMHKVIKGVTQGWGATYNLDYLYAYPPLENAPVVMDVVREVIDQLEGINYVEMPYSLLAGEDFAYYSEKVPAAYFMLGCKNQDKAYPWHHSCFNIDEACLKIGCQVMANAMSILANQPK